MDNPSKNAADFVRKLTELTNRLASKNIVVASLHADWSHFGSWQLQAQRGADAIRYAEGLRSSDPQRAIGPEVVRLFWDGRESILYVEVSPTRFCSAPNEWKTEHTQGFNHGDDGLLSFAEDYLTKRLGA